MKTKKMLTILFLALGLIVCQAEFARAGPMGTAFTYQGHLYDANHVADGLYDFQFKLYDANVGGGQVGNDVNKANMDVVDGYFTVELDFGAGPFNGDSRWLNVGVRPGDSNDVYTTLIPRQNITPTPYALYAANGGIMSIEGVSNPGGNVDLIPQDAITITPDNLAKTIAIGESHSAKTDNPHQVTATQTGALASVDGVSNPGGNVDFVAGSNMTITPDSVANTVTFSAASPIRRVVRGVITFSSGANPELSQSFSPSVDPSKSVVLLSDAVMTDWFQPYAGNNDPPIERTGACLISLTSSEITVRVDKWMDEWTYARKVSYQIIEYN